MKRSSIFLCVILLCAARAASANVLINEVAWMGTTTSADAEWMELYNDGSQSVNLAGWSLSAADGSPSIQLSGSIAAQGYFLLERTSNDTLPGLTANQIYSGSLSNSGEHLTLKDNLNNVADDLDASSGWPAGDNTTKQTMQRSSSDWITAPPTPDAPNATVGTVISSTSSTTSTDSSSSTSTATVAAAKDDDDAEDVIPVQPDPRYYAEMVAPDVATVGTPVSFSAIVKDDGERDMVTGRFQWYLADGSSEFFTKNTMFDHVFYYPGTYTIALEYYSNRFKSEPDSIHRKSITIVPASISVTPAVAGVTFGNDATKDIDLGGWNVSSGNRKYVFPKYTVVPAGGTLSVSDSVIGWAAESDVGLTLMNPEGVNVCMLQVQNPQ